MITTQTNDAALATYQRDLGNGLMLRWSTTADTENICQLAGQIFRDKESDQPNERLMIEITELMSGRHPLMGSGDYGIVEDTRKVGNPIVACTCLWLNHWQYEGIQFTMGQPEIVATDPNYRNKGLIRALFEMVHARSASRGDIMQAITGIPYFYRQFGYEYVLDLGGSYSIFTAQIPKANEGKEGEEGEEGEESKKGEAEACSLRTATIEDIPTIQHIYSFRRNAEVVAANVHDDYWRYEIQRTSNERMKLPCIQMIVDTTGNALGFAFTSSGRGKNGADFNTRQLVVLPGTNLRAIVPSLLRALQNYGAQAPLHQSHVEEVPLSELSFSLGRANPLYEALGSLAHSRVAPYAWYVRIRDIPAFLRRITPVLEQRLARSVVADYSGELRIDHYKGGLRLVFEHGKLTTAEKFAVPVYDSNVGAGCPELVFLQLILCHRSLDELRSIFPEVWAEGDTELVLKALFPASISAPLYLF